MSTESTTIDNKVAKQWDACIENTLIKSAYGLAAGATVAVLLFRSPVIRSSVMSFAAGIGAGYSFYENRDLFLTKKD